MRKILLSGVSALALLSAAPAESQHGGTRFPDDGGARMYNPGGMGGPLISKSFACSFWYGTSLTSTAVLLDMSTHLFPSLMIALTHDLGTKNLHLATFVADFAGNHGWSMISRNPVPNDGDHTAHNISFAVTTSLHLMTVGVDGKSMPMDELIGGMDTGPFDIAVRGSRAMIGAALGPSPILPGMFFDGRFVGMGVSQYEGGLDQFVCHFEDTAYSDILTMDRKNGGFTAATYYAPTGQLLTFTPMELGPMCSMVFGKPTVLCLRGDPEFFKLNNGGATAFTTIEGRLEPWLNGPWTKWWP